MTQVIPVEYLIYLDLEKREKRVDEDFRKAVGAWQEEVVGEMGDSLTFRFEDSNSRVNSQTRYELFELESDAQAFLAKQKNARQKTVAPPSLKPVPPQLRR